MIKGSLLFLGTGSSLGVPLLGCLCPVCSSQEQKNRRLRPSALVRVEGKAFIIDAGPDFRAQALHYDIRHVDGLVFTHAHFDHIGGLEDARALSFAAKQPVACLLSQETLSSVEERCRYLFHPRCFFDCMLLPEDHGEVHFQGVVWHYISYYQSGMKVNGYRLGSFAYVSDIRDYSEAIFFHLKGVRTLVLSTIHKEPSGAHFSFEEGIDFSRRVGAEKTYFTHLSHHVDHDRMSKHLPKDFYLGYDGLEIFW